MSGANKEGTIDTAYVLSADKNSDWIDVRDVLSGVVTLKWTDAAAADAVVKIQEAMTNAPPASDDIFDIATMTQTIGAATGKKKFDLTAVSMPYFRVNMAHGTETAAKITTRYYFKGAR